MNKYKLPNGQKLIKEIGNFLLVEQNHFAKGDIDKGKLYNDKTWFKYYIHKKALNNIGNYGVVNIRDKNTYSVFGKDFNIIIYNNLKDAFEYVEKNWINI